MFSFRARHAPLLLAYVIAAVIPIASTARAAAADTVAIRSFNFSPMTLSVTAGATVTWKNEDEEPHTVTSVTGLFRSGALDTNDAFKFRFDRPGTYKYTCSIHPRMVAEIVVK